MSFPNFRTRLSSQAATEKKVKMAEVALEELITFGKITPELIMDKVAHLKEEFVEFFEEER